MTKKNLIWLLAILLLLAALWWFRPAGEAGQPQTVPVGRFYRPVNEIFSAFDNHFVFVLSEEQRHRLLHELLYCGVGRAGEGFSEYVPPDRAAQYVDDLHGRFVGIGIELDGGESDATVAAVVDSSPAFEAHPPGVLPGDRIVAVDQTPTAGRTVEEVGQLIRGPAGSRVCLLIDRPGIGLLTPLTLVRARINRGSVRGFRPDGPGRWDYILPAARQNSHPPIGYIRVSEFIKNDNESTMSAFGEAIERLRANRLAHLVIDLRSNVGGAMSQAVEMVDRFVADGLIVEERGAHQRHMHRATGPGSLTDWALVVLVDRGTASAGEVVAGSLAFNGRAVLVGERTFGKGTMQKIFEIPAEAGPRSGLLKLTVAYLYLPSPPYGHPFDRTRPPADFRLPLDHWPEAKARAGGIKPTVEVALSLAEQQEIFRCRRELDLAAQGRLTNRPTTQPGDPDEATAAPWLDQVNELASELLRIDRQLSEAVDILSDQQRYRALLRKAPTTAAEPANEL